MALSSPLHGSFDQFVDEINLLLRTFRPEADVDPSDRLQSYWRCFVSWRARSKYGPAVERILFYDLHPDGRSALTELHVEPLGIRPAAWDENLRRFRSQLENSDFEPDRVITRRWVVTWMFQPRAMVLYRPIIRHPPNSLARLGNYRLSGFLILQLESDFIRDRIVPEILSDQFRAISRSALYTLSVELGGRTHYIYDPVVTAGDSPGQFAGYSLRPAKRLETPYAIGPVDLSRKFPLSADRVNLSMLKRGAVQRVGLRTRLDIARIRGPEGVPFGLQLDGAPISDSGSENQTPSVGWSSDLPRLLVIADAPKLLILGARRKGVSSTEAINQRYKRSVAMGMLVLVLVVGSMAMVALSQRSAARLASTRIEAAASQSHQLRTPLAGISLLADNMVQGALGPGDRIIEYGEAIRAYGRHLNELVSRTLHLAALDSPMRPASLAVIDVSEFARDALEEAQPMIDGAGFTVECCCPNGLPAVHANPEALRQSLGELLGNAVKYGLPGRWIKIETDKVGSGYTREVRIRIHDRGRGISARDAREVFEPFHRVRQGSSSSIPGSGLGLALARSAIEAMGGRLTLESQLGHGSIFTIRFSVR